MTERSLQVTYRKGRPFAAYLHLSHATGEKSARTVASSDGLLVVDYGANGRPVGVEITAPRAVSLERLNELLEDSAKCPWRSRTTRRSGRRDASTAGSLQIRGEVNRLPMASLERCLVPFVFKVPNLAKPHASCRKCCDSDCLRHSG